MEFVWQAAFQHNSPRPPGGVHAGWTFEVRRLPRLGENMPNEVISIDKEIRKQRSFLLVRTRTFSLFDGELFTGLMKIIIAV
jgi:hypothetical protein